MGNDPKSRAESVSALPATTSGTPQEDPETQLSAADRVNKDVGTAAMDGGVLSVELGARPAIPGMTGALMPGGDTVNDAEVMLRVKAGDQAAFDYLVQKYRRQIVSLLYRMSRNSAAAEDLAQEVFLRVYRSRQTYEASAKFTTWLYRIATNLAVNHARDTKHERPDVMASLDEQNPETGSTMDVADPRMSVEEELVRRERMQAIRSKVEALPERQKTAVILHKYQQMDYKQIAEVMKLSESATKSLLFRAYETLREELKQFC
jgi:RNA polymerase sigma-70 factor, ECF subfamily